MAGADPVLVPVEWALRGKSTDDAGYRLISRSTGSLGERNFSDILDRYSPGTLDSLPQVTVNSVKPESGGYYIGMAIYEPMIGGIDQLGRDVTFTRYFCVPYPALALGAVTYMAMYDAFRDIRLPNVNDSPITVGITRGAPDIPAGYKRALVVSEALLTANPVCIVDAEATSVTERLAYIDAAMSLLPYGMRAEMNAATWTSSVYPTHKFRLFFSDSPRKQPVSGVGDHLVRWGAEEMGITLADKSRVTAEYAQEYRDWLEPLLEPSVTSRLAQQTEPTSFKPGSILQMVEGVKPRSRSQVMTWPGTRQEPALRHEQFGNGQIQRRESGSGGPGLVATDRVELIIGGFNNSLKHNQSDEIAVKVAQLGEHLSKQPPTPEGRRKYQDLIRHHALLRADMPLKRKVPFYKVLLRAAFGERISYRDYQRIQEILGGRTPHEPLLQAIDELGTDQCTRFVVLYHLKGGRYPKSEFNSQNLIDIAADAQLSDAHSALTWDATLEALRGAGPEEKARARSALRERGYLAPRLRDRAPSNLQEQVNSLTDLLTALYREQVDGYTCGEIFTGYANAPTEALFIAACRIAAPGTLMDLLHYFAVGIARSVELAPETRASFTRLGLAAEAGTGAEAAGGVLAPEGDMAANSTEVALYENSPRPGRIRRMLNPGGGIPDRKVPEKQ
jgi:hypothetical protein